MRIANRHVRSVCETLGGHSWNGRWVIDAPGMDLPAVSFGPGWNFLAFEQAPFYGPLLPGIDRFMIREPAP